MRLKRVEMQGFKSFADKTNIEFMDGITTIVGPNGSGKSNVSDAVRWVLGEQSAKSLRGSSMPDVIFTGTQARKMLGLAEVSLVLDNSDSKLPIEYNEVTVTRRIYRSGDSEYYINKSSCRLKDIQELFMDTGVGKDGYSIIGQGKIDEILSSKSEERRNIFEEASGIVKYRTRKDEAIRKLEGTTTNLDRVNDILLELGNNMGSLEEKSKTAKKYLELKSLLRQIDIRMFLNSTGAVREELDKLNQNISAILESASLKEKETEQLSAAKDEIRLELEKLLVQIEKSQEEYFGTVNEIEKVKNRVENFDEKVEFTKNQIEALEQEILESKENIELLQQEIITRGTKKENMLLNKERFEQETKEKTEELEVLLIGMTDKEKEIEDLKQEVEGLKERVSEHRISISQLDATIESNTKRIESIVKEGTGDISSLDSVKIVELEIKENLDKVRKEKLELEEKNKDIEVEKIKIKEYFDSYKEKDNKIKQDILETKSKINYLEHLEKENEGYSKSVKSVIELAVEKDIYQSKVYGTLATLVSTKEEYERAIEISMGGYLQNIVVDKDSTAKDMIEYLKANSFGRATFLPLTSIKTYNYDKVNVKNFEGYIGQAIELVSYDKKFEAVINLSLARTVIVDKIESAIAMSKAVKGSVKIVTLAGEVIATTGSITGGQTNNKTQSLLGRSSKISKYKEKLVNLEKALIDFEKTFEVDRVRYEEIAENQKVLIERLNLVNIECGVLEEKLVHTSDKIAKTYELRGNKEKEKEELFQQNEEKHNQKQLILEAVISINMEINNRREIIEEFARFNKEKQEQIDFLNEDITNLKISLSSFDESSMAIDEMLEKIKEDIENFKQANQKKQDTILSLNEELSHKDENNAKDIDLIVTLELKLEESKIYTEKLKQDKKENMENSQKFEENYIEAIKAVEKLKEQASKVESKKVSLEAQIDNFKSRMWDDYELTISSSKEEDKHSSLDSDISKTKLDSMLNKTKGEIKELGEVSVSSIEEFKEATERFEFISKQKTDLEETKAKLQNIIDNTTSIMKVQFVKQFNEINKNFSKVFVELFGGGKAELKLSDSKNVLESGIEIEVQPPGKKLQNMMLLSGGERALTAIALLFSILKIKSPPFCILDEIEAALDDINVVRFAKYIQKYSKDTQFIVITHRKGTMEVATSIYGVTMQEYGVSKLVSMKMK